MKKVTIKGLDGKEIPAYVCSDHPKNFPTDMTNHKVEDILQNNLNELDVNENSAGGGAHISFVHDAHISPDGSKKKEEFPTTLSWDAPKEIIKDFVKKVKEAQQEEKLGQGTAGFVAPYDYPLDKAFQYGYNVDVDPLNKLFKLAANLGEPNKLKVRIDDTIDSDLLETGDLRLGRLYRVAGVDLVARFVAQITIVMTKGGEAQQKILLQIKHHGIVLYVEERQLMKASDRDVKEYLNQPF